MVERLAELDDYGMGFPLRTGGCTRRRRKLLVEQRQVRRRQMSGIWQADPGGDAAVHLKERADQPPCKRTRE